VTERQHSITRQQKYAASIAGLACELAWQLWKAGGDFYYKYSLLQILPSARTYVLWYYASDRHFVAILPLL